MLGNYPVENPTGGVAINNINILSHFGKINDSEIEIYMVSFGPRSMSFNDGRSKIIIIKAYRAYYALPFLALIRLAWEVGKINPDLLHVHGSNLSPYLLYAFFMARNVKKVVTIYGYDIREKVATGRIKYNSFAYRLLKYIEKKVAYRSDILICNTNNLKNDMISEYGEEIARKAIVIPTGVDLDRFDPLTKGEARKALNIDPREFIIFHAKGFFVYNGQEYLIRSLPKIKEQIPNVKVYLAGDGPMRLYLESLIGEFKLHGDVVILGNISNGMVRQYLGAADVICMPSVCVNGVQENSSIFLIESMAMEKPLAVSRVGGLADCVKDRETGILIPDKDPNAIASAVVELYSDPALSQKLGKNARRYVEKERTWDMVVDQINKSYHTLFTKRTVEPIFRA